MALPLQAEFITWFWPESPPTLCLETLTDMAAKSSHAFFAFPKVKNCIYRFVYPNLMFTLFRCVCNLTYFYCLFCHILIVYVASVIAKWRSLLFLSSPHCLFCQLTLCDLCCYSLNGNRWSSLLPYVYPHLHLSISQR